MRASGASAVAVSRHDACASACDNVERELCQEHFRRQAQDVREDKSIGFRE